MKKQFLLKMLTIFITFTSLLLINNSCQALSVEKVNTDEEKKEETVVLNNDYFDANNDLDVEAKIINGNAFIAGSNVVIRDTKITGSLFVAGKNVTINSTEVEGSIYAGAERIDFSNVRTNNIYVGAKELKVNKDTKLEKNLYVGCENLYINATLENVYGATEKGTFGSETIINEVNLTTSEEFKIDKKAKIEKFNVTKEAEKEVKKESVAKRVFKKILNIIKYVIITALLSLIIAALTKVGDKIKELTTKDIVIYGLIGFGITMITPFISILLMITGVFSKLAVVIILLYILGLVIASTLSMMWIAKLILEKAKKEGNKYYVLFTALVALCVGIIKLIPVIGGILGFLLVIAGFGIFVKLIINNKK